MKKLLLVALCICIALSCFSFVGCNKVDENSGITFNDDGSIKSVKVGATSLPHAEILNFAKSIILDQYGWELEVIEVEDWVILNPELVSGDLYANYFQHELYLAEYNRMNRIISEVS